MIDEYLFRILMMIMEGRLLAFTGM